MTVRIKLHACRLVPASADTTRCQEDNKGACAALVLVPVCSNVPWLTYTAAVAQDHYLHAENMYEIWNMKHRKLKWGLACAGVVSAGFIIPSFAIHWQKSKVGVLRSSLHGRYCTDSIGDCAAKEKGDTEMVTPVAGCWIMR